MNGLINYLLEGSLVLGTGLVFYKVLFERLTFFHWNRVFLLALLASVCVLPAVNFDLNFGASNPVAALGDSMAWMETQVGTSSPKTAAYAIGWQGILIASYLLGGVIFLTRLLVGILKTLRLIHNSEKIVEGDLCIAVNPVFAPASFFRFILLPSYDPDSPEHRQIIVHESVHVGRFHSMDILLVQFVKVVWWFNPLVYLLERSLREVHEYQADQVVTQSYSSIAYSRLLLKQLSADCGLRFMNNFNQFQTKKRIIMMNKTKSNRMLKFRFLLTVPLLVLMVGLFSCDMVSIDKEIVGTWKGSGFSFEQTEGPDVSAMIQGGKQLHIDGQLLVKEDGTYQISVGQQTNGTGVWKVDGDKLVTTDSRGEEVVYEIKELTSDQLVTVQEVKMDTPMGTVAGKITLTYTR